MSDITNIFESTCYKKALKARLAQKRELVSGRYTLGKLAEACRVQSTYLSRVLSQSKPQLSEDQLYGACRFLGCSHSEQEFLFVLRSLQMCTQSERRSELVSRVRKLRIENTRTERALQDVRKSADLELDDRYYLDPNYILTHACLAIQRYAEKPVELARVMDIAEQKFISIISDLESWGLISLASGKVALKVDALHLSRDSRIYEFYRQNQRLKALEKMKKLDEQDSYNFSATFTSSRESIPALRLEFQKFLKTVQKLTQDSIDEDAFQLNFDLFKWT